MSGSASQWQDSKREKRVWNLERRLLSRAHAGRHRTEPAPPRGTFANTGARQPDVPGSALWWRRNLATMRIREARETDAVAIVRLMAEANPNMVVTPESWLHRCRT